MRYIPLLASALLLGSTLVARADIFTLTNGSDTISFSLPATLTPDLHNDYAHSFLIFDVPIRIDGQIKDDEVIFSANGPGYDGLTLQSISGGREDLSQVGAQLFSGPDAQPTFLLGTFDLKNGSYLSSYKQDFTLVISADPAPPTVTPEPSTFALLSTGVLGGVAAIRRRMR